MEDITEVDERRDVSKKACGVINDYGGMISRGDAERIARERQQPRQKYTAAEISAAVTKDLDTANIEDRVYRIFNPKVFEKNGRKRQRREIVLGESRCITITLWDNASGMIDRLGIERGDRIVCYNVSPRKGVSGTELAGGSSTQIVRVAPSSAPHADLSRLKGDEKDVDVIGRVVSVDPIRYFTDLGGRLAGVSNCTISDGHATLRMAMWRSSSAYAAEMHPGDYVKAEFVGIRKTGEAFEITAGDSSRILINNALKSRIKA